MNFNFDDDIGWAEKPPSFSTYVFNYYRLRPYNYYGPATASPTYNVSFAFSGEVKSYHVTAPKFYEVFGLTGGLIAFIVYIFATFAMAFNNYLFKYTLGR